MNQPIVPEPVAKPTPSIPSPSGAPLPEFVSNGAACVPMIDPAPTGRKVFTVGTLVYTTSGLAILFFWLLFGDFALAMRERSVGELNEKFLLKYGASNALKQALTGTIPLVIGLILGPVISYQSDRHRGRWGRRIPFLLIPTPIAGFAMIGIGFSPQIGEWLYQLFGNTPAPGTTLSRAAASYVIAVFTVLWVIFEVAVIISGAVMMGLVNDVVPRAVLGRFHGLFRAVSLYDGILFSALLFKHAEQHFTLMFVGIGVLFGGGFTLMCLMVKEGDYPPPPAEDPRLAAAGEGLASWLIAFFKRFVAAAVTYLRECFAHPYYQLYFAMVTLAALTFKPINDFTYRYAVQLGISDQDYGFLRGSSYFMSLVLAFPLGMLVDRVHVLRMAMVALLLYTLTAFYGSFFIHDGATFAVAFVAHTVLSGTYFTCSASLGQQLLPRAKFTQYASAAGIVASLVGLVYAPTIGAVLDWTGNFYRLTFWLALAFALATMGLMLILYRKFNAYGGVQGYVAPGDIGQAPRHEPPAHLWTILLSYFVGASLGGGCGYLASFQFQSHPATSLAHYPIILMENKPVRDMALFFIATGLVPGAILGSVVGTKWARRLDARPTRAGT